MPQIFQSLLQVLCKESSFVSLLHVVKLGDFDLVVVRLHFRALRLQLYDLMVPLLKLLFEVRYYSIQHSVVVTPCRVGSQMLEVVKVVAINFNLGLELYPILH